MSQSSSLVRSTFILTASIFITKILGILYVIPFYAIIGGERNLAPYNYAYNPYTVMLVVAGAGVPLAVAKYVSKYNAIGAYKVSQKLYKSSLIVMSLTGLLGFIILYLLAPTIAEATLAKHSTAAGSNSWNTGDITEIIRVISVAVIFIPFLATFRGIFQGYDSMGPTAVSTVIEQVARIVFLLGGALIVIKYMGKNILLANEVATFAAAIGAVFALLTLWYYWRKRKPHIERMIENDHTHTTVSYRAMYKEILLYSVPFVIVSLCFPLYLIIDQFTHNKGLDIAGVPAEMHDPLLTMLNLTTNKLVMIPTSLASGFAISLVPAITRAHASGQIRAMHHQIRTSLGLLMFLTVPASLGIMVLAAPLYTSFYSFDAAANHILYFYAPVGILIALLSVTSAMLQGIDKQAMTVWIVIGSLVIKALINLPLIVMFHTVGAVFGTAIALTAAIICNLLVIKKYARFKFSSTFTEMSQILLYSLLMVFAVELVYLVLIHFMSVANKFEALLIVIICAVIGALVYGYISLRSGLAERYLGARVAKLSRKVGRA
ncbi:putative polysaccharide biosynthesis protein [Macrococcus equipercicus]|uniref:Polysaccharide biosynthesis protein n=1 Tax=Macrococcus equipercicus TaxID=69967 RepID=A0A9Q9BKE2_9STAP|nr:polysaccharide biosynthesis protein [Macrococcus equipercicus]KAA1038394.1 polysaccharide biosynthesis protein [Macrococcus equipercicus]UTH13218.1 polysaccharide biosynthesis protein [Macrococcus equipercicus]